jgi:hypothetical protein
VVDGRGAVVGLATARVRLGDELRVGDCVAVTASVGVIEIEGTGVGVSTGVIAVGDEVESGGTSVTGGRVGVAAGRTAIAVGVGGVLPPEADVGAGSGEMVTPMSGGMGVDVAATDGTLTPSPDVGVRVGGNVLATDGATGRAATAAAAAMSSDSAARAVGVGSDVVVGVAVGGIAARRVIAVPDGLVPNSSGGMDELAISRLGSALAVRASS